MADDLPNGYRNSDWSVSTKLALTMMTLAALVLFYQFYRNRNRPRRTRKSPRLKRLGAPSPNLSPTIKAPSVWKYVVVFFFVFFLFQLIFEEGKELLSLFQRRMPQWGTYRFSYFVFWFQHVFTCYFFRYEINLNALCACTVWFRLAFTYFTHRVCTYYFLIWLSSSDTTKRIFSLVTKLVRFQINHGRIRFPLFYILACGSNEQVLNYNRFLNANWISGSRFQMV